MSEQPRGQGWRGDLGREQYPPPGGPSYGAGLPGRPGYGADSSGRPSYYAPQGQPPWESSAPGAAPGGDPAAQPADPAGQPPGAAAGDASGRGAGHGAGHGGQRPQLPIAEAKSFLNALFDFGFTSLVTPKIIKALYILIVIVAGLSALAFAVSMLAVNLVLGLVVLLVGAPLCFLVVTALYRIVLEFFMVIFRMAEDIRALRDRGQLP